MQRETAWAKVNLCLHVTGRREDGYHLLESLAVFADVGETLEAMPGSDRDGLSVTGRFASCVPGGEENAVLRACRALRRAAGARESLHFRLVKEMPAAAGLGGGTADAAAALRLLRARWNVDWPSGRWLELAATLGADVPMCFVSRPLWASGVGERVRPLKRMPSLPLLLVNPGVALATPQVFAARKGAFSASMDAPEGFADLAALVPFLKAARNDLQDAAMAQAPAIGDVLAALAAQPGCLLARMSGSGATCFGVFDGEAAAARAEARLAREGWWVKASRSLAA